MPLLLNGPLAQLVERIHGMDEVSGSIPLWSTGPLAHLVERVIRIDEVTGSNPVRSTISDLPKKLPRGFAPRH